MWKQVRGLGLSYNFAMEVNLEKGMLSFHLHKSTNIAKAYQVSKVTVLFAPYCPQFSVGYCGKLHQREGSL